MENTDQVQTDDIQVQKAQAAPSEQDKASQAETDEARDRVKRDLMKYKLEAEKLRQELEDRKLSELKAKEQWQELAEVNAQKASEYQEKYNSLSQAIVNDKKLSAVRMQAIQAGIRQEALDDLDLMDWSDVQVETTSTGRVEVLGAKDAVLRLKTLKPYWFKGNVKDVNTTMPGVQSPSKITSDDLIKASLEAQKSGDYKKYEQLMRQYQSQG